jgi:hypothetical protein
MMYLPTHVNSDTKRTRISWIIHLIKKTNVDTVFIINIIMNYSPIGLEN